MALEHPIARRRDEPAGDWAGGWADDDWLDGPDEFEWLEDTADAPGWRAVAGGDEADARERRREWSGRVRFGAVAAPADADAIRRRRAVAAAAAFVVLALAIVVPVLALSGGGGSAPDTLLPSTSISVPEGLTPSSPGTSAPSQPAAPAAKRITVSLPDGATLSSGDEGSAVTTLQRALLALGYDGVGKADGIFGSATESAVTDFQRSSGLAADGIVGSATVDALNAALAKRAG